MVGWDKTCTVHETCQTSKKLAQISKKIKICPSQAYEEALITQNNCPAIIEAVALFLRVYSELLMATTFDSRGP